MAILSTHQFYPRTTRLQFLRYNSSAPFKKQSLCATNRAFNPESSLGKTQQRTSNFVLKTKVKRWGFEQSKFCGMSLSGCSWLDKWNEAYKNNKLKRPQIVLNYRKSGEFSGSDGEGAGSGSTMEKIVEKLKKFGYIDDVGDNNSERVIEKGSIEDIFHVEEGMLPNSRGGFSEKYPLGDDSVFATDGEIRFPWEKPLKEEEERYSVRKKSNTYLAKLTLPERELRRLTNLALRIKNKMRITGAGVTQEVVETIHKKWKSSEVLRLKIEGAPALNMKRMHEILEVNYCTSCAVPYHVALVSIFCESLYSLYSDSCSPAEHSTFTLYSCLYYLIIDWSIQLDNIHILARIRIYPRRTPTLQIFQKKST